MKALRIQGTECIAFIGSGGKTTVIFELAREVKKTAVVTTTTHLGEWQIELADKHIVDQDELTTQLNDAHPGVILITGPLKDGRATAISERSLSAVYEFCRKSSILLLIEADGSRQKPLKGWADHEPVIPAFVDAIIMVAGLGVLGSPLTEENIHRSKIYSEQSGLQENESISPDAIAKVLIKQTKKLDSFINTAKICILNQADTPDRQSAANGMAKQLLSTYDSVVITSTEEKKIYATHEPIAGIILAAGEALRYGKPKQLLKWRGQAFIRKVAQTALLAGLSQVIVVTGAYANEVKNTLQGIDIDIVYNDEWNSGQGSSIRQGISALHSNIGSAIFLLADQPQIDTTILTALKEKHAEGLYPIVAPMVLDRRANPVLFDKVTFQDLMEIQGDTGGRAIFHKHRVEYLPWHDDRLLLDVDTPEQYERLISQDDL